MRYFIFLIPLILLTSCSLMNLSDDLNKQKELKDINIQVNLDKDINSRVIVGLVDNVNSSVINYRIIEESKKIFFIVKGSTYQVYAFEDLNNDYKYSINEKIVISPILTMDKANTFIELDIISAPVGKEEIDLIHIMKESISIDIENSSAHRGSITSMSSEIFSDQNIKKGLWEPYAFTKTVPFGIFLLQEYDPKKKVLLFVHGISGSPRNFTYLIENINKSKYQAMVAYYPTGVSIGLASEYLVESISELKIKFGFENIDIIAHSMGGIVSRDMINILCEEECFIDTFITISSPLGGDERAISGVEYSPVVMPVWKDMASNSIFLKELYRTPIKDKINYYLLFGVKSSGNSDGVVSIPSQLRMEAQKEAKLVRGFNEDHMSILSTKEVSNLVNSSLEK